MFIENKRAGGQELLKAFTPSICLLSQPFSPFLRRIFAVASPDNSSKPSISWFPTFLPKIWPQEPQMILPAKGLLVVAYLNFRMPYLQIKILPTLHLKLYCFPYRQSHFVSFHSVSSNKFKHQPNTDTRRKPVSSAFFEYRCLCFQNKRRHPYFSGCAKQPMYLQYCEQI